MPQPDSPTMPSVSPGAMSNEMPLTAWTSPRARPELDAQVARPTSSALTVSATELRVERLAQAVADQVEAEHRDHDRDAGDDRQVRRALRGSGRVRQHRPPLRRRRILRAEAEEAEAGDVDDRGRHRQRALHDHRRDRVREDVRVEDPPPLTPTDSRGEHEVVLASARAPSRAAAARRSGCSRRRPRSSSATRPGPSIATIAIANSRPGIASMMSIMRMITRVEPAADVAGDRAEERGRSRARSRPRRRRSAASSARRRRSGESSSRPSWSRPSQCSSRRARAAARSRERRGSVRRLFGAINGAKTATITKMPTSDEPTRAPELCARRYQASRQSPPVGSSSSSSRRSRFRRLTSRVPDPRVEEGVRDVDGRLTSTKTSARKRIPPWSTG